MNTLLNFAQSSSDFTTYTTTTTGDSSVSAGVAAGLIIGYFVALIISYVITAFFLGKIFKKAGVESWVAWVPFYNIWKALELGGQQGFWSILIILPFVNIVAAIFMIIAFYNIGLKLGKSGAFVVLAIFLPIVWLIWLALDKSVWNDALGAPSKAPEHIGGSSPAAPTV
jgi:hypothetical protein